jgi:hypothetical protein
MLPLASFLDELAKIAAFANAMMPPSSSGAANMARLPGPSRVPSIDPSGAMGANYHMHMPTVMADMQARVAKPAAGTGTIPAPAAALPHPTVPAPAPGRLGAPLAAVPFKGPLAHMPTARPAGFTSAAGGMLGKLKQPISGVLHAAHAA